MKGLGATPVLDSVKKHLLVTIKVNNQTVKTLVDQQTAGADLISLTFYTLHKIPLHKMNPPVTLQMTMKGSRGSLTHYIIVQLDWLGYLEERTMLVAALKDWDVILGSPGLRDMKAVINIGTMTVSIQPPKEVRFILQQWIPVPAMKMTRKKIQPSFPKPVYAQSVNQIVSAATTLKEIVNSFDEFPDAFPEIKNLELPPLRLGMDYLILLKDPNLEIKPRNRKLKHKFLPQLLEKLRQQQKSGRVYKPNPTDTSCSAITRVMQQDDKNTPSMFQNAMNTLFQDELRIFVYIYIDDIFIFSKTYKEYVNHVRHVLQKLRDNQFFADRKKSQFLPEESSILGHVITRRGIQPMPGRVRKILDWPTPSNIKELKLFLGIVNYCSQFAPLLASISSPLTVMAGSTANWDWTHTHQRLFELIKQILSADPAVRPLD